MFKRDINNPAALKGVAKFTSGQMNKTPLGVTNADFGAFVFGCVGIFFFFRRLSFLKSHPQLLVM